MSRSWDSSTWYTLDIYYFYGKLWQDNLNKDEEQNIYDVIMFVVPKWCDYFWPCSLCMISVEYLTKTAEFVLEILYRRAENYPQLGEWILIDWKALEQVYFIKQIYGLGDLSNPAWKFTPSYSQYCCKSSRSITSLKELIVLGILICGIHIIRGAELISSAVWAAAIHILKFHL